MSADGHLMDIYDNGTIWYGLNCFQRRGLYSVEEFCPSHVSGAWVTDLSYNMHFHIYVILLNLRFM